MNTVLSIPILHIKNPEVEFLKKYPGKLVVFGPEEKKTPGAVARIIRAYKQVLDAEEGECFGGIYSQGPLTLCYITRVSEKEKKIGNGQGYVHVHDR